MREIKDGDIIKVEIFGFAAVLSIDGYMYCLNLQNEGDIAKIHGRLINKEDTIVGLLPAPPGTFAYYGCSYDKSGVCRPGEELGIEYPGEKATNLEKILKKKWEKRRRLGSTD